MARILDIPVNELAEESRLVTVKRVRDGRAMTVPLFQLGRDEVWGATAMVLAEFLVLLGWNGQPRRDDDQFVQCCRISWIVLHF